MENTNKPQWLIDAENEIKNFENSKYGKMSQKEFTKSEVGKHIGEIAKKSGQLDAVRNPSIGGKAAKLVNAQSKAGLAAKLVNAQSKAGKVGGKIGGKKHVESGHLDNIRKDAIKASVNSRINKRLKLINDLYNNIATLEWFTLDDVLQKYNINDESGIPLKDASIFNYLKTTDLFESKLVKNSNGGKGKKYYKKISKSEI